MLAEKLRCETAAWQPRPGFRLTRRTAGDTAYWELSPQTDAPAPALVYCHGGGFFLPLQCAALRLAQQYAAALGARIFLPEYRLLPQYPAPAAFEDCLAVWRCARAEAGDGPVLLYGESAGGALAAGLALYARDQHLPPAAGQVLIYPALDDRSEGYPSRAGVPGAAWNAASNAAMWRGYLQRQPAPAWLVPLRAEQFVALPPAYIEAAENDILRDEAAAYARALKGAGVPTEFHTLAGATHGFDADADAPLTRDAVARRIAAMERMLAKNKSKETES